MFYISFSASWQSAKALGLLQMNREVHLSARCAELQNWCLIVSGSVNFSNYHLISKGGLDWVDCNAQLFSCASKCTMTLLIDHHKLPI